MWLKLPFLEESSPPPFYQEQLSQARRQKLDAWFIGSRSQAYYLRRFEEMDKAGRLLPSFHWAAFVMTFGWLLYRKRYLDCFVYCVAGLSFVQLTVVLVLSLLEFLVVGRLPDAVQMSVRLALGFLVWLFWAVQVAQWSNAYYYRMARREIADALSLYPYDFDAQKAHLSRFGGVSFWGLLAGFGIFATLAGIVAGQFLPIWGIQQEKALIDGAYRTVYAAHHRVERIVQATERCPTQLPLSAQNQQGTMQVVDKIAGTKSTCAVVLTVRHAKFPVRYLNGQNLVMYRTKDGVWHCQTSLNKDRTPKRCVG